MKTLGIDPGAKGAIVLFGDTLAILAIWDMPTVMVKGKVRVDAAAVGHILREAAPDEAFMERVGAMPGQGVASMFAFGMATGIVLGALAALEIPVTLLTPTEWKGALRVPKDKGAARARASQLLPSYADRWPMNKHDGRAEAALIGLYGIGRGAVARHELIEW